MSANGSNRFLNIEDANLRVRSGNVHAKGITVGGITVGASHGLQRVSDVSNTTSNTLQFTNATTSFKATSNIEVGGDVSYTSKPKISVESNVVTEYTGPHDRPLRKYPEVALTSASQAGYVVTRSNEHDSASYYAYKAFNEITNTTNDIWYSSSLGHYNTSDGSAATSGSNIAPRLDTNTDYGEWIALELPKPIKLDSFKLWRQSNWQHHHPVSATLYAKKTSSDSWSEIYRYDDIDVRQGDAPGHFNVNSQVFYGFFAFVARKRSGGATNGPTDGISLAELELYGHEEGSGSLDTTLKTVYNVPATTGTQLEVYYDGKDLADGAVTNVTDLSPNTNGGTGTDVTVADGAFVFNGTSSLMEKTSLSIPGSDNPFTISFWLKNDDFDNNQYILRLGINQTIYETVAIYKNSSNQIVFASWTLDFPIDYTFTSGQWNHISLVYPGGGWKQSNLIAYVDGKPYTFGGNLSVGGVGGTVLSLATSLTLRLGGFSAGNTHLDGSIANFRLYSKVLNADQVKELYDYQKDYFLGSKSQVTLYKGHLGVGVTEPSGQLELAGDERIQEYPPRGLVGDELVYDPAGNAYDYNVEGHGVFKLLSSVKYHNGTGSNDRRIYKLFDKSNDTLTHWSSFNSSDPYDAAGGSGAWVTTLDGGSTITAHIAEIQMPYKITLKKYILTSSSQVPRALKTGMIVGSNDGNVFHVLHNVPDFGFTATYQPKEYTVDNTTTPYRIFRLLLMNTNGHQTCNMNEWRLFGTPGPTTLDKGSLSLTRSLDVPRISRYDVDTETPRPEKLVVDFDTTVNSSPTDISGKGNHGTFNGGASYSAVDKAFNFDASTEYIESTLNTGDTDISVSLWLKREADTVGTAWMIGNPTQTNGQNLAFDIYPSSTNQIYLWTPDGPTLTDTDGGSQFPQNQWVHVVGTRTGTTLKLYIDGVDWTPNTTYTAGGSGLSLPANSKFRLGLRMADNVEFTGKISNSKVYDVVLEPSEVKKLYNLGRTGRSMVISDTAVGIGKVPEAQLDVRGTFRAPGTIVQVKQAVKKDTQSTTAGSPVDVSGLSVTIHPKFSNSKILVSYQVNMGGNYHMFLRVVRTQNGVATLVGTGNAAGNRPEATSYQSHLHVSDMKSMNMEILDSINETGAIEYKVQFWVAAATHYTAFINRSMTEGDNVYYAFLSSSITVKEVCQ